MNAELVFKALSDEARLKILTLLIKKPSFAEELSLQLNITPSTVGFHLKKLEAAGIVRAKKEQYYRVFYVDEGFLKLSIASVLSSVSPPDTGAFEKCVENECFVRGRVKTLPVQSMRRIVVYEKIAENFKKGTGYTEGETLLKIADVCDDFLTAKTEMLSLGILFEKNGKFYKAQKDGGGKERKNE